MRSDCGRAARPREQEFLLSPEHLVEIRELAAARPELPQQLIVLFAKCMEEYLAACEQAAANGDGDAFARAAHRIAGSAASLGAPRLRALADELESAAGRQALSGLPPQALPALRMTIDDTIAAYRQWLDGNL
jgi:HPt (histidine-containing phosphotransfer) domain-containing protein